MTNFSNKHLQVLENIVGKEDFCTDEAHLRVYSFDSTRLEKLPHCIIFPKNEKEIQEILLYANKHKIPITPRGAGSGMSGGCINSGIILALQKHFHHIIHIDTQNLSVTTQPAIINAKLNEALKPHNLFFPPDPASNGFSTIGGNIAENAGGMSAVKYGVSKDYVLSMRAILGNAELLQIGHNTLKDVAGYNLLGLMCGSEGTLGIITELTLKLKPIPKYTTSLLICFQSIQDLAQASCTILSQGITPNAMEFLDHLTSQALNQTYQIYPKDTQATLIIKLDSFLAQSIDYEIQEIQKICQPLHPLLFFVARNTEEEQKIWFGRKNASQAMKIYGVKKLNEDITVPRSKVASFLQFTQELSLKYDFLIPCFGHIGDGNIHTNLMLKSHNDLQKGHQALKELFEFTIALGGTLSGEHGIGITKSSFMPLAFPPAHLELFRKIKQAFDPNNILNPNKMGF